MRKISGELHTHIPASVKLFCLRSIQIPKHTSIKVTAIDLNCVEYLLWISKAEGLPGGRTVVDKPGFLTLTVMVHIGILMQLVPKMGSTGNPGKIAPIQLEWDWLRNMSQLASSHEY